MRNSKKSFVVGLDLGGTNFRLALISEKGEILARNSLPTPSGLGTQVLIEKMAEAILTLVRDASIPESSISAVGMGIPGMVVPREGRVIFSPNIPEINDCSLIAGFHNLVPWPLAIDNDANAFALGENWLGAGKGCADMLGITMGTGVGGGLVLQGRIWQGEAGTSAEIGHMTIEPNGYKCNCGN